MVQLWQGAVCVAALAAWVGLGDYGQCARACRVKHGSGWVDSSVTGARALLPVGAGQCACWEARSVRPLTPPPARLFAAEPAGFPYIENGTAGVCGEDGRFYGGTEAAAAAAAASVRVASCGPCGTCSNRQDVGTYHNMSQTLTKAATTCGILFLFGGELLARPCMAATTT